MKRSIVSSAAVAAVVAIALHAVQVHAQPRAAAAPGVVTAPEIPFDAATDFLKYSPDMNLGEVLGVAVNSKGRVIPPFLATARSGVKRPWPVSAWV